MECISIIKSQEETGVVQQYKLLAEKVYSTENNSVLIY